MTHIEKRLQERDIKISKAVILGLCYEYNNAAVIIAKNVSYCDDKCLVFLIIRDNRPVTIMYRRSSQTNTAAQLRVNQIIDITS